MIKPLSIGLMRRLIIDALREREGTSEDIIIRIKNKIRPEWAMKQARWYYQHTGRTRGKDIDADIAKLGLGAVAEKGIKMRVLEVLHQTRDKRMCIPSLPLRGSSGRGRDVTWTYDPLMWGDVGLIRKTNDAHVAFFRAASSMLAVWGDDPPDEIKEYIDIIRNHVDIVTDYYINSKKPACDVYHDAGVREVMRRIENNKREEVQTNNREKDPIKSLLASKPLIKKRRTRT